MEIKIFEEEKAVIEAFAKYIISCAQLAIQKKGSFHLVLSGGNSPKRVFQFLASTDYNKLIDWKKTFIFFTDERFVPYDDSRNNATMVLQTLFPDQILPESHFFRIKTVGLVEENAKNYMATIREHFHPQRVLFDLVLLGLGDNVHTASLFPHKSVLLDEKKDVKSFFLEEENIYRVTMNAPLLNATDKTAFLVFGENKALAVKHVLESPQNIGSYPAQLINREKTTWFLDNKAASLLTFPSK